MSGVKSSISAEVQFAGASGIPEAVGAGSIEIDTLKGKRQSHIHLISLFTDTDSYFTPVLSFSTQREICLDGSLLALFAAFQAKSKRDRWRRALPRGIRSGAARNLESTTGLRL